MAIISDCSLQPSTTPRWFSCQVWLLALGVQPRPNTRWLATNLPLTSIPLHVSPVTIWTHRILIIPEVRVLLGAAVNHLCTAFPVLIPLPVHPPQVLVLVPCQRSQLSRPTPMLLQLAAVSHPFVKSFVSKVLKGALRKQFCIFTYSPDCYLLLTSHKLFAFSELHSVCNYFLSTHTYYRCHQSSTQQLGTGITCTCPAAYSTLSLNALVKPQYLWPACVCLTRPPGDFWLTVRLSLINKRLRL